MEFTQFYYIYIYMRVCRYHLALSLHTPPTTTGPPRCPLRSVPGLWTETRLNTYRKNKIPDVESFENENIHLHHCNQEILFGFFPFSLSFNRHHRHQHRQQKMKSSFKFKKKIKTFHFSNYWQIPKKKIYFCVLTNESLYYYCYY